MREQRVPHITKRNKEIFLKYLIQKVSYIYSQICMCIAQHWILLRLNQAWRGRKRQTRGHHSPSSIQGEWLATDDQKNNILASLCLASYLAVN